MLASEALERLTADGEGGLTQLLTAERSLGELAQIDETVGELVRMTAEAKVILKEVAGQLRDAKIDAMRALQPQRLASANFGCGMWLNAALPANLRFEHPLVLLAQQLKENV